MQYDVTAMGYKMRDVTGEPTNVFELRYFVNCQFVFAAASFTFFGSGTKFERELNVLQHGENITRNRREIQ